MAKERTTVEIDIGIHARLKEISKISGIKMNFLTNKMLEQMLPQYETTTTQNN